MGTGTIMKRLYSEAGRQTIELLVICDQKAARSLIDRTAAQYQDRAKFESPCGWTLKAKDRGLFAAIPPPALATIRTSMFISTVSC
jgi:hypothetical protein